MELPTIIICTAAVRANANLVLDAQGRGPDSMSRTLAAASGITSASTPTHYLMQDMSATDYLVEQWQALANNADLPAIAPNQWGVDGVISDSDAIEAFGGGNLHIYTAAGAMTDPERDAWRDGILAGRGLAFIPFEL